MIRHDVTTTAQLKDAFAKCRSGDVIAIENRGALYELAPKHVIESPDGAALTLRGLDSVQVVGLGLPQIQLTEHGSGLLIHDCRDVMIEGIFIVGLGPLRGGLILIIVSMVSIISARKGR